MKPSAAQIKSDIQAQDAAVWSEADARPDALDKFEGDLANALAAAWSDVVDGFVIASVPVTGGSAPSGPITGGVGTLAPGTLTNSASFSATANKFSTSFPDGATEGLSALVDAISQALGQAFAIWVPGYSATLVATGGLCSWVAPNPPALPTGTPGGWSGGSIQAQPLSSGASAGDAGMTGSGLELGIGAMADPSKLKQNQGALQPALSALIKAVASGFATTWTQWKAGTNISGGTSSGASIPPLGVVTGAVSSPTVS
ncbi:MAG: hypothetical protein ACREA9_03185 [Pyrinomonadaceae bacterium]